MKYRLVFISLIPLVLSLACSQQKSQDKEDQDKLSNREWNELNGVPRAEDDRTVVEKRESITTDSVLQVCDAYFNLRDSMYSTSLQFFETRILSQAESTTEPNRELLKALFTELKSGFKKRLSTPFYERSLMPVFQLDSSKRHLVESSVRSYDLTGQILERDTTTLDFEGHRIYPDLFDSLQASQDLRYYAFSDTRRTKGELSSVENYKGECLEYFAFEISASSITPNEKVLFLSRFPLDLDYSGNSRIDSLWKDQFKYGCYDCYFKFEPRVTFATLSGIEGLYFMYADSWPLNTEYDFPHRSLVMDMDGYLVDLWYEEVDLFGCSCL